ncbi:hypothetical protein [Streptomyces sp. NPDC101455]|uniref:hypothetical protein n=1 Tax=Streptomyces sp. NPDC101455 TaxID=3366142 RepID=UPI0037FE67F3
MSESPSRHTMSGITRTVVAAATAAGALIAAAIVTASPAAAALNWHCKASSHSIDQANYSGPLPDQWDFTVRNCTARSGSYVYSKASISWDGPYFAKDNWYDGAYYHLVTKKSVAGTDPTVGRHDTAGLEAKLENSNAYGNGSYATATIKVKVGASKGYTDGTLYLDWRRCCGGYKSWGFAASPAV